MSFNRALHFLAGQEDSGNKRSHRIHDSYLSSCVFFHSQPEISRHDNYSWDLVPSLQKSKMRHLETKNPRQMPYRVHSLWDARSSAERQKLNTINIFFIKKKKANREKLYPPIPSVHASSSCEASETTLNLLGQACGFWELFLWSKKIRNIYHKIQKFWFSTPLKLNFWCWNLLCLLTSFQQIFDSLKYKFAFFLENNFWYSLKTIISKLTTAVF